MKRILLPLKARLAGWLLVLAYVCTIPALLPAAFATLARLEGSHRVEVRMCGEETRVVLAHDAPAAMKSHEAIHHHCLFARMLTRLAEPDRGNELDHLLKFTGGTNRLEEKRVVAPEVSLAAEAVMPHSIVVVEMPLPRPNDGQLWTEGPPPRPPTGLVGLKSVLLLI